MAYSLSGTALPHTACLSPPPAPASARTTAHHPASPYPAPTARQQSHRVVHYPFVYVRSKPNHAGEVVGRLRVGTVVQQVGEMVDGWIRVHEGWMLVDGKRVGLGKLLQPEPAPSDMTGYRMLAPLYDMAYARLTQPTLRSPALVRAARSYFDGQRASLEGARAEAVALLRTSLGLLRAEDFEARAKLEVLVLSALAQCHCHLGEWGRALVSAVLCIDRSSRAEHLLHPLVWHAHESAGLAACKLGLLAMAERLLSRGQLIGERVAAALQLSELRADGAFLDCALAAIALGKKNFDAHVQGVASRLEAMEGESLLGEVLCLCDGLEQISPGKPSYWVDHVLSAWRTARGRTRLVEMGFSTAAETAAAGLDEPAAAEGGAGCPLSSALQRLSSSDAAPAGGGGADVRSMLAAFVDGRSGGTRAVLRILHRALSYVCEKDVDMLVSSSIMLGVGETGGRYHCVAPTRVATPSLPPLVHPSDIPTLRRTRMVVCDDRLPADMVAAAARELATMDDNGSLSSSDGQPCNPGERSRDMPLWERAVMEEFAQQQPGLAYCVRSAFNLAGLLERELELELRVPQTVLLASYPPQAYYRRHLDSYAGKDIPRMLTVLIYLAWEPRTGGQLRCHLASGSVDVEPLPGRLVIFYSQEVEHEVLPSRGRRLALTLWIWDVKKDDKGR
ncbi:hypothetical protein AB1Y20_005476 [Prymnesium parvum]|uniref:Fe2OG dioxygenase domain-containing protein n=1 Tax=Prymnesium parvum TaxID=97485 RepID=A0AB34J6C8_PRYPA